MAKRTKSPKKNNKPSKKRRVDATTKTTSGNKQKINNNEQESFKGVQTKAIKSFKTALQGLVPTGTASSVLRPIPDLKKLKVPSSFNHAKSGFAVAVVEATVRKSINIKLKNISAKAIKKAFGTITKQ